MEAPTRARSAGFSPLEILIVVVTIGLLASLAAPRLAGVADRLATSEATRHIITAHYRARMTAILEGRRTLLSIRPDSFTIRVIERPDTVLRWWIEGPTSRGIALSGPTRPMVFTPVGITMGLSNGTYRVSRGSSVRRVIISRLGRVRVE